MALAHHVGARQRHHLARTVARRRKNSAAQSVQPLEDSPRTKVKREARQATLDQIELDKLNGLENGRICREHYRKLCRKPRPAKIRQKRKAQVREADTYRGVRRNAERGTRMGLALKAKRIASGESRSDFDRRRWQEARA